MAGGYPPPPPGYGGPPPPQWGPPPGGQAPPAAGGFAPPPAGYAPAYAYNLPHPPQPGAPYGVDPNTGIPFSDKQKIVGFVLQFFFGAFGAGRFYTGHTGIAIAQIAVSWLTCGLGTIWPTIDGILMLAGRVTDAQGRPLRD
jgi:TM2 domain-containing membrane protein YozV